jgi:hypothetical protein
MKHVLYITILNTIVEPARGVMNQFQFERKFVLTKISSAITTNTYKMPVDAVEIFKDIN